MGEEAERVTKVALANYDVNSDRAGVDHGLEQRLLMAVTLCYVSAHLGRDLVNAQEAQVNWCYCERDLREA